MKVRVDKLNQTFRSKCAEHLESLRTKFGQIPGRRVGRGKTSERRVL